MKSPVRRWKRMWAVECVCVLGWGVDRKFCRNLWVSLLLLHLRLEDNLWLVTSVASIFRAGKWM